MRRIIQSTPNFSEGRRADVIQAAASAVAEVPGLRLLDVTSDREQNRSVLTVVGDEAALLAGILELFASVIGRVDLRSHQGEHPRVGAVDVIPFIPIEGAQMEDCVTLAREAGRRVAERFAIPVFLYEEAATAPHRRNLEDVRRGQLEGLAERMRDPLWKPDFGPDRPHPSAGAAVVGARMPLIAFNINLGTSDLAVGQRVARAISHTSGGYRFVKATALATGDGEGVQVSINMTDYKKTPLHRVFETVQAEAQRFGVRVTGSQLVGLVPEEALIDAADHFLRLEGFEPGQVLQRRIREAES